jgi:pilus assembly protein Flp/PilA
MKHNLTEIKNSKMMIKKFLKDENGVTSIEYALIASLIALAILSAISFAGNRFGKVFKEIAKVISKVIKRAR